MRCGRAALAGLLCLLLPATAQAQWPSGGDAGGGPPQSVGGIAPTVGNSVAVLSGWGGSSASLPALTSPQQVGGVVVAIGTAAGSSIAVSTVTSANLTFSHVIGTTWTDGGVGENIEYWYAPFTTGITSEVISVTLASSATCSQAVAFTVGGIFTPVVPYDQLAGSKQTTTLVGAGNLIITDYSTAQYHDILLWSIFGLGSTPYTDIPSTFGIIANTAGVHGVITCGLGTSQFRTTVPEASATLTAATSGHGGVVLMALTGDPPFGSVILRQPFTHW